MRTVEASTAFTLPSPFTSPNLYSSGCVVTVDTVVVTLVVLVAETVDVVVVKGAVVVVVNG